MNPTLLSSQAAFAAPIAPPHQYMPGTLPELGDTAWRAVSTRDRHYDGQFVYGAFTTRIYCRPSCPARHPHRQNSFFFPTPAEAERHGYVACRRCRPDSLTHVEESIRTTLFHLDAHVDHVITLSALSPICGLSPNHFHQAFKRIVGLSPKAFCDTQRLLRFKQLLRRGESITSAGYEAGYGSSRAFYEQASRGLGMTPASYKRGGEGVRIRHLVTGTVLGRLLVGGTERGICTVLLGESDGVLVDQLHQELPGATFTSNGPGLKSWTATINACQREDPLISALPLGLRVRIFQARVYTGIASTSNP